MLAGHRGCLFGRTNSKTLTTSYRQWAAGTWEWRMKINIIVNSDGMIWGIRNSNLDAVIQIALSAHRKLVRLHGVPTEFDTQISHLKK